MDPGKTIAASSETTGVVVPVATSIWLVVPLTDETPPPTAEPFTNTPVTLRVPAPCAPPVGAPIVTPEPLSVTLLSCSVCAVADPLDSTF